MVTKSNKGNAGASDKVARGIMSERDFPAVKIARRSTRIDMGMLAGDIGNGEK